MSLTEISPVDNLRKLLQHKKNNPLEVVKVKFEETVYKRKKSGALVNDKEGNPVKIREEKHQDVLFYINIEYCCFNSGGWGPAKEGTIEERKEWLMKTFEDTKTCMLIYAKFDTLARFRSAFTREMHWINQTPTRRERFEEIHVEIFNMIESRVKKEGGLDSYVEKHYDSLVEMLPMNPRKVELDSMNRTQLLEELAAGRITTEEADTLIRVYEANQYEMNRDKLCPFSGNGFNAAPKRICSWTNDPKILGDCGSCRVAAEWEEAYG